MAKCKRNRCDKNATHFVAFVMYPQKHLLQACEGHARWWVCGVGGMKVGSYSLIPNHR